MIYRIGVGAMTLLLTTAAYAEIYGKSLVVKADSKGAEQAVVSIAVDNAGDAGEVILKSDGQTANGTIRNGELIFVVDSLPAGGSHTYTIEKPDGRVRPSVVIDPSGLDRSLTVSVNGNHFTTVHYNADHDVYEPEEWKKPFLWPLHSADETPVTRAWPMGDRELSRDHPHHKSMWGSYGDVNGADFWGEGNESGRMIVTGITYGSGAAVGWVHMEIDWRAYGGESEDGQDKRGDRVLQEVREYRFYPTTESGRYVDQISTYTAVDGDAKFGDTKEGGLMAFRVRDIMTEGKGGTITMADGTTTEKVVWGKPSPWCDYSGELDDAGVHGIAVFDHPDNLRHPTRWHVRGYGLMGANCFGLSHFTANEEEKQNGNFTLKKGESITFHYRAYIHAGDVTKADVAGRYADYAAPPTVSWK